MEIICAWFGQDDLYFYYWTLLASNDSHSYITGDLKSFLWIFESNICLCSWFIHNRIDASYNWNLFMELLEENKLNYFSYSNTMDALFDEDNLLILNGFMVAVMISLLLYIVTSSWLLVITYLTSYCILNDWMMILSYHKLLIFLLFWSWSGYYHDFILLIVVTRSLVIDSHINFWLSYRWYMTPLLPSTSRGWNWLSY